MRTVIVDTAFAASIAAARTIRDAHARRDRSHLSPLWFSSYQSRWKSRWSTTQPEQSHDANSKLGCTGEGIAELGYRAATARQIVKRPAVNIAAINYHFGNKDSI